MTGFDHRTPTCDEIVGVAAIDFVQRGFDTTIGSGPGRQWIDSDCVSCGACSQACPTAAISDVFQPATREATDKVRTVCTYCGVGCQTRVYVKDDKILYVDGRNGPANEQRLCVKGRFGYDFVHSAERLTRPLIRRNGRFEEATWNEALDTIADRIYGVCPGPSSGLVSC